MWRIPSTECTAKRPWICYYVMISCTERFWSFFIQAISNLAYGKGTLCGNAADCIKNFNIRKDVPFSKSAPPASMEFVNLFSLFCQPIAILAVYTTKQGERRMMAHLKSSLAPFGQSLPLEMSESNDAFQNHVNKKSITYIKLSTTIETVVLSLI